MRNAALAVASMALALACPSARADPILIEPIGPYIHRGSGFVFPTSSGDFSRTRVIEYDNEATDVSAGYDVYARDRPMAATVYVYPAPPVVESLSDPASAAMERQRLCREHFEGIKADIVGAHPGATLLAEGGVPSPSANFPEPGLNALFEYQTDFRGKEQPVKSVARLYCYFGGKWLIAYRLTAPVNVDYERELAKLMTALPWPDIR